MIRKISTALQEKAIKELNEVPSRISSDIQTLREWLKKQPHLQSANPSEQLLVGFLRGNKYSLEKSKEKLDMYYTLKTVLPEIYQNRNPFDPAIQEMLKLGIFLPLKNCATEDGVRVCLCRFHEFDNSKHKLSDFIKLAFMIFEILILEDDNYVISGEECVIDMQGVGYSNFTQWTPTFAKKLVVSIEKSFPLRMKANYILHTPPAFDAAYGILKMFVADKHRDRYHIYKDNVEEVYKKVPRQILPKEYGGEGGTIQELRDHWKMKVEKYSDWYKEQESQHSDESLRPDKPRTSSSLFGVEGSFRKLEMD